MNHHYQRNRKNYKKYWQIAMLWWRKEKYPSPGHKFDSMMMWKLKEQWEPRKKKKFFSPFNQLNEARNEKKPENPVRQDSSSSSSSLFVWLLKANTYTHTEKTWEKCKKNNSNKFAIETNESNDLKIKWKIERKNECVRENWSAEKKTKTKWENKIWGRLVQSNDHPHFYSWSKRKTFVLNYGIYQIIQPFDWLIGKWIEWIGNNFYPGYFQSKIKKRVCHLSFH